jgi:hypothetical protein
MEKFILSHRITLSFYQLVSDYNCLFFLFCHGAASLDVSGNADLGILPDELVQLCNSSNMTDENVTSMCLF